MYDLLSPGFTGRCTAPLLVDRVARRAVCNESSIIARSLAELAIAAPGAPAAVNLVPAALAAEIDRWNERTYEAGGCCLPCPAPCMKSVQTDAGAQAARSLVAARSSQSPPPCPPPHTRKVNNGVYKCGFSTTPAGFQAAEAQLFAALDEIEGVLRWGRWGRWGPAAVSAGL